jgi:hypothetical protein
MSDGRLALIFFEIGLVLTLISMVLGPFGITEWAIAAAAVACITAIGGMYLAFSSWDEPDEKNEELENSLDHTDSGTTE